MANIDNLELIATLKLDIIDVKLIKGLSKHWIVEIRTESDMIFMDLYTKNTACYNHRNENIASG